MLALFQTLRSFKRKGLISDIVVFAGSSPQDSPGFGSSLSPEQQKSQQNWGNH